MAILSKARKPDNCELHNSLKLSFMNIWGLRLKFNDCKSFLESNSPDILAVWDKPEWLNWFWQFLCDDGGDDLFFWYGWPMKGI